VKYNETKRIMRVLDIILYKEDLDFDFKVKKWKILLLLFVYSRNFVLNIMRKLILNK
jgi:hypothetical protein